MALTAAAPLLARLPIDPLVAALCDAGKVETVTLKETPDFLKAFLEAMPVSIPVI